MTNLQIASASNEIGSFLDYLYEGLEGYVYTAGLDRDPATKVRTSFQQEFFVWPEQRTACIDWLESNAAKRDVYVAPAVFGEPSSRKSSFRSTNVVWVEFDGNVPSSFKDVPEPTLRVRSSGPEFQHCYWRLDAPESSVERLESVNKSLAYTLGADSSGWDCNQVLRVPGTFNYKRDLPVGLISRTDETVTTNNFSNLASYDHVETDFATQAIPDVTEVVMRHAFPDEVIALFKSIPEDRSRGMMRLGYYLAEMGMSDVEMFSVLRNADDRWGKFKDRTDREQRLSDLISVAREKHPYELVLGEDVIPIFGLDTFLNSEIIVNWLIEGLLEENGYMLLTGPSGVGKTQFSLRWAMRMALGQDFLGYTVSRPMRIVFFSLEMGHATLKHFLLTMCEEMTEVELAVLEQNLLIVPLGEPLYVDSEEGQKKFEDIMMTYKPDGFFFDSIGSSSTGELSSEATVKKVMDWNDRVRQRYNVFSWYIHHMRKATSDNKKPSKMADVYGGQYIVNRATSILCLWPGISDIEVIPLKMRLAEKERPFNITRLSNLDFFRKSGIGLLDKPVTVLTHKPDDAPVGGAADGADKPSWKGL